VLTIPAVMPSQQRSSARRQSHMPSPPFPAGANLPFAFSPSSNINFSNTAAPAHFLPPSFIRSQKRQWKEPSELFYLDAVRSGRMATVSPPKPWERAGATSGMSAALITLPPDVRRIGNRIDDLD
jgi:hypothetical protein